MTERLLRIRIEDRPAALERTLGRIRVLTRNTQDLSLGTGDEDTLDLLLPMDRLGTVGARIAVELRGLRDVREVSEVQATRKTPVREMALVRVSDPGHNDLPSGGRVVERTGEEVILEITGSREEVEEALARLRKAGTLTGVTRTGRICLPESPG